MNAEQALTRLQALCSRSEKCPADVRQKLQDWNVSSGDAETIVAKLQAAGFIDERRYARALVHDKSTLSHWGALKIRQALQGKKIAPAIIVEALQQIDPAQSKRDLSELLLRKNATLKAASPTDRKAKLLRFALSKGYEYRDAYELVCRLLVVGSESRQLLRR